MVQGQFGEKRFRPNKHQLLRHRIINRAKLLLFIGFDNSGLEEEFLTQMACKLRIVNRHRYLKTSIKVPKCNAWFTTVLPNYSDQRFRAVFRVNKLAFLEVLRRIEHDPVFTWKCKPQVPVVIQLAVALSRFGHSGNMASHFNIARDFGISDCGTIQECTRRVITAILKMHQLIKWPDQQERNTISEIMAQNGFRHCIGFVDGSHIKLELAPLDDSKSYYNRKCFNSIQLQIVCNPAKRIIHSVVGYPGAVHDSKVFRECSISRNPEVYFSKHQFILGDAGYKLQSHLITPFKRNGILLPHQETFNKALSHNRVAVEHTFGILKSRFQSLNGLRIHVNRKTGHKRACDWIQCIIILHNMLLESDPWDVDLSAENGPADDEDDGEADCDADSINKREILAQYLAGFH